MTNVLSGSRVVTALGLAILVSTVHAQNIDEMVKWTSAEVVHYDVVAEYTGTTPVLVPIKGAPVTSYPTQVKDRYEIGFDWSPTEMAMVGKPVFKNFPSTLPVGTPARSSFNAQACPQHFQELAISGLVTVDALPHPGGAFQFALQTIPRFVRGSTP